MDDFAQTRAGWPKTLPVEGVNPQQPFFFSEKWDKLPFLSYKNLHISFCRFLTSHACDGQTDGQTQFLSQYRDCITCSGVNITHHLLRHRLSPPPSHWSIALYHRYHAFLTWVLHICGFLLPELYTCFITVYCCSFNACLALSLQHGETLPRRWTALDQRDRNLCITPTIEHAVNATENYWQPCIPAPTWTLLQFNVM